MSDIARKRSLIVMRQSPYGCSLSRASIDLALAMGAFEQDFDLLFMGAGILQLLQDQHSELLGVKNAAKTLGSLPLYDKESVYVDAAALQAYGLETRDLVLLVEPLEPEQLAALLNDCDHVLSC